MSLDPTALTREFSYQSRFLVKYTTLGPPAGQPLILIHGTPWSSRLWAPFALALSRYYHVHLFDNPGYGISQTLGSGTEEQGNDGPLVKQAEVFAALYSHWGFPGKGRNEGAAIPHVIAHDNAGLVSLRAYLEHGCRYRSLTLVDVVAVGPWGLPFFKLVAENMDVFHQIPPQLFEGIVRGYIKGAAYKPLTMENEDMLLKPWIGKDGPGQDGFLRQMKQASTRRSSDVEERYHALGDAGVPVKIVWGKDDQWVPCERAEKLRGLIGGKTEIAIVEEAGHLIQLDQPERLLAEILGFVMRVDGT